MHAIEKAAARKPKSMMWKGCCKPPSATVAVLDGGEEVLVEAVSAEPPTPLSTEATASAHSTSVLGAIMAAFPSVKTASNVCAVAGGPANEGGEIVADEQTSLSALSIAVELSPGCS
jgi:hypothetical protein